VPLPIVYNLRSVKERWTSSLVAIIGIAGTVSVFIAMLALARGFQATLVSSGQPQNAIVQQAGADSEMTSAIELDAVRMVEDQPQVARRGADALVSPEVVVIAAVPLRGTNADANVQMRGVSPKVLGVRDNVKVTSGRFFTQGLYEIVVGKHAAVAYEGLDLGRSIRIGPARGRSSASSTPAAAFDSEIWADSNVLNGNYQRPRRLQSVTVKLRSADDFAAFDAALHRTLQVQAVREPHTTKASRAPSPRSSPCSAGWSPS
jgi:putative ABC transport system permease protein